MRQGNYSINFHDVDEDVEKNGDDRLIIMASSSSPKESNRTEEQPGQEQFINRHHLHSDDHDQNSQTTTALGPEELVRRETRAVMFLRLLVLVVLIIVGGLLSFGTYRFVANSEEETYAKDFDAVATRFTESFKTVIIQSMWSAYSMGVAVTSNANLVQSAPNFVIPNFDELTKGAIQTFRIATVIWAPLIHDIDEKQSWETYAQKETDQLNGASSKSYCNVCGNDTLTVDPSNANVEVALPIGTYTCGQLEWAGQSGLIPQTDCPYLASYTYQNCHCQQLSASNNSSISFTAFNATTTNGTTADVVPTTTETSDGHIIQYDPSGLVPVNGTGPYLPVWQISPSALWSQYGLRDLNSDPLYHGAIQAMIKTQLNVISETSTASETGSLMFSPVYSTVERGDNSSRLLGSIVFNMVWDTLLDNIVPLGSRGVTVVLENSCGQKRTFQSTGDIVVNVGIGDLHDPAFSTHMKQTSYAEYLNSQEWSSPYAYGHPKTSPLNCAYRISVYASNEYRSNYITNKPRVYSIAVILIFVFTCLVFVTYDCYVGRRQRKVMHAALQRDEIVSSLFPDAVRSRLLKRGDTERDQEPKYYARWNKFVRMTTNPISAYHQRSTSNFSTSDHDDSAILTHSSLPMTGSIADYFPCVTVVFADISGFTAWSSQHDPSQVFHLLETVYHTFDKIAKRYGIFKIETIGDCYVAVAGLPVYQPDHAIRVVKFSYECILHMQDMLRDLQSTLGPSTSALSIRIGIHSGPVIAGVLRGEKSRFQLFGDTMNTTSRVQTTGEINKIQISVATAKLLEEGKKSHWIEPRDDLVAMKGKGMVQTYWVDLEEVVTEVEGFDDFTAASNGGPERWKGTTASSKPGQSPSLKTDDVVPRILADKNKFEALVETNTDLLMVYVKKIVAARRRPATSSLLFDASDVITPPPLEKDVGGVPPRASDHNDDDDMMLHVIMRSQLRDYIATIASAYYSCDTFPFHNFEHASYVAQATAELMEGMVNPNVDGVHDSSDPLMQFALVFFAVIYNVPVRTDSLEDAAAAAALSTTTMLPAPSKNHDDHHPHHMHQEPMEYAWSLLTRRPEYQTLWHGICGITNAKANQVRLHQLLHRAAHASAMTALDRRKRWDQHILTVGGSMMMMMEPSESTVMTISQQQGQEGGGDVVTTTTTKSMIVFESIVQAAQVMHYMQDENTFQSWQKRWLEESVLHCHRADDVVADNDDDPRNGANGERLDARIRRWYERELLFFEQYVLPLANDLASAYCGGGGASLLLSMKRRATENRKTWEMGGEDMVRNIVKENNREKREIMSK